MEWAFRLTHDISIGKPVICLKSFLVALQKHDLKAKPYFKENLVLFFYKT
jgi:hypothetical protein